MYDSHSSRNSKKVSLSPTKDLGGSRKVISTCSPSSSKQRMEPIYSNMQMMDLSNEDYSTAASTCSSSPDWKNG